MSPAESLDPGLNVDCTRSICRRKTDVSLFFWVFWPVEKCLYMVFLLGTIGYAAPPHWYRSSISASFQKTDEMNAEFRQTPPPPPYMYLTLSVNEPKEWTITDGGTLLICNIYVPLTKRDSGEMKCEIMKQDSKFTSWKIFLRQRVLLLLLTFPYLKRLEKAAFYSFTVECIGSRWTLKHKPEVKSFLT